MILNINACKPKDYRRFLFGQSAMTSCLFFFGISLVISPNLLLPNFSEIKVGSVHLPFNRGDSYTFRKSIYIKNHFKSYIYSTFLLEDPEALLGAAASTGAGVLS